MGCQLTMTPIGRGSTIKAAAYRVTDRMHKYLKSDRQAYYSHIGGAMFLEIVLGPNYSHSHI